MKYCSHCGAEALDEAVVCVKCGCALDSTHNSNGENEILAAAKVFMMVWCVLYALTGITSGLYLGAMLIWWAGLLMGGFFCLPIIWTIPMTIYLDKKIKNNEPISFGFKIWTLIFACPISGILLLLHKNN